MSTELTYLAYTAIFTGSLWVVYIASQVLTNGPLTPQNYIDPTPRPVPLWGQRAHRAYLNAVEAFAPFAALTLIIHVASKETSTSATLVIAYFWLRVIHAVVYWFAVPYIRTISFTLSWLCVVGLFWHVIA
jgi:uncharacterized MAPEG superfamily protein